MQEIIQKINSFFSELRKKDRDTKKQWLVILTSASMLIVLVLWIISINLTIKKLGNNEEKMASESGIGSTLNQGLKVMSGKVGGLLSEISDQIQNYVTTTNSVTIQPTNLNFSNNIEPVTPKKFP